MKMLKDKNFYINFIISIIIINIPLVEFIKHNIEEINSLYISTFIEIFKLQGLFIILLIILFFYNIRLVFYISFIYYLIFQYYYISSYLPKNLEIYFLLFLTLFFTYIFFTFDKLRNFLKIYFLYLFIINCFFIIKDFDKITIEKKTDNFESKLKTEYLFNKKQITEISNNNNNRNIFYIIFDESGPLEEIVKIKDYFLNKIPEEKFEFYKNKYKNLNIKSINKKITELKITNIKNSFSPYNSTSLAIPAILNLDTTFKVDTDYSDPKFYYSTFPTIMQELDHTPLVGLLDQINYEFKWMGNSLANCKSLEKIDKVLLKYCFNTKDQHVSYFSEINKYVLDNYLKRTPIYLFMKKKKLVNNSIYIQNDPTNKLVELKNLNKNKRYYFLVHAMFPHDPYIYNPDCSERDEIIDEDLTYDHDLVIMEGYLSNYSCMLKRIEEITLFLEKNYPESVIIFQSDHGNRFSENINNSNKRTYGLKILNLIKFPKSCKNKYNTVKINHSVNTSIFALNCALNKNIPLIKPKKFKAIRGFKNINTRINGLIEID